MWVHDNSEEGEVGSLLHRPASVRPPAAASQPRPPPALSQVPLPSLQQGPRRSQRQGEFPLGLPFREGGPNVEVPTYHVLDVLHLTARQPEVQPSVRDRPRVLPEVFLSAAELHLLSVPGGLEDHQVHP